MAHQHHVISPYDRASGYFESRLGLAVLLSAGFHLVVGWVFLFIFPNLIPERSNKIDDYITVELLGSLAPPAPAAPKAKVNPDLKGPDVVEAPKAEPAPAPQPPQPKAPDVVTAPQDVIPLGPKAPEKPPEIKKTTAPPKVTPPKVEEPKPKPKPAVNNDSAIEKRMKELERKVEADALDDEIDARMMNIAKSQGRGSGEGSESGGATSGQRIHPEKAKYYQHIRDIISSNWIPPSGAMAANLAAVYIIRIEPDGQVSMSRLERSSGNPDYDLSVERAVKKSSPFPMLPPIFEGRADNPALVFDLKTLQQHQQQ